MTSKCVMSRTYDRRSFLAALGAGGALQAPFWDAAGQFGGEEHRGKLVFSYDDSPDEDYTKTFPVHREEGVPACVAAVSSALGTEGNLSVSNLHEMVDAGWEVVSHTVRHRAVGTLPVTADVKAGDERVYEVSNRHGAYSGDRVRIFDGDRHELATVAGQGVDETGEYVRLQEPVETAFDADDTAIRYTDERIRNSLRESKRQLEAYGFDVSNLVLPYGINGRRARELVPQYYGAVANSKWDGNGLNPIEGLDPHRLHRVYFRRGQMTIPELERYLDAVAERDVLGLLGGHSAYESFTAERTRKAIRLAKERNIEILTLREALADYSVVPDTATATAHPTTRTGQTAEATRTRRSTDTSQIATEADATRAPEGTRATPSLGTTATAEAGPTAPGDGEGAGGINSVGEASATAGVFAVGASALSLLAWDHWWD